MVHILSAEMKSPPLLGHAVSLETHCTDLCICLAPIVDIELVILESQITQVNIVTKYLTLLQLIEEIDRHFLSSLYLNFASWKKKANKKIQCFLKKQKSYWVENIREILLFFGTNESIWIIFGMDKRIYLCGRVEEKVGGLSYSLENLLLKPESPQRWAELRRRSRSMEMQNFPVIRINSRRLIFSFNIEWSYSSLINDVLCCHDNGACREGCIKRPAHKSEHFKKGLKQTSLDYSQDVVPKM